MMCDPEKIYLYLDQELADLQESLEVEAHLKECPACADVLRAERAVLEELDRFSRMTPPVWSDRELIQQTYDDLSGTLVSRAERRRALMALGGLSLAATALLSFHTLASYLSELFLGLRIIGMVVWNVATVFLKGLSFVAVALAHGLADETQVTPLPALSIAVLLSLVLARLMKRFEVSTNQG